MFDLGITQAELAHRVECSDGMISAIVQERKMPGRALANAIERITADWSEGPIKSEEWDAFELEQKAKGPRKDAA